MVSQKIKKMKNFCHIYYMAGLLKSKSIGTGEIWSLANIAESGSTCACIILNRLEFYFLRLLVKAMCSSSLCAFI